MDIDKRKLTNTQTSRMITFDKNLLDKYGFKAGTYHIIHEVNKITIVKNIKEVIV